MLRNIELSLNNSKDLFTSCYYFCRSFLQTKVALYHTIWNKPLPYGSIKQKINGFFILILEAQKTFVHGFKFKVFCSNTTSSKQQGIFYKQNCH